MSEKTRKQKVNRRTHLSCRFWNSPNFSLGNFNELKDLEEELGFSINNCIFGVPYMNYHHYLQHIYLRSQEERETEHNKAIQALMSDIRYDGGNMVEKTTKQKKWRIHNLSLRFWKANNFDLQSFNELKTLEEEMHDPTINCIFGIPYMNYDYYCENISNQSHDKIAVEQEKAKEACNLFQRTTTHKNIPQTQTRIADIGYGGPAAGGGGGAVVGGGFGHAVGGSGEAVVGDGYAHAVGDGGAAVGGYAHSVGSGGVAVSDDYLDDFDSVFWDNVSGSDIGHDSGSDIEAGTGGKRRCETQSSTLKKTRTEGVKRGSGDDCDDDDTDWDAPITENLEWNPNTGPDVLDMDMPITCDILHNLHIRMHQLELCDTL